MYGFQPQWRSRKLTGAQGAIVVGQMMICDAPDVTTFGIAWRHFVRDNKFSNQDRNYAE